MIVLPLLGDEAGARSPSPAGLHATTAPGLLLDADGNIANSIIMISTTTVVGFGCMVVSAYRGIVSLGLTLTIGVTCSMIVSLITLPALTVLDRWNAWRVGNRPGRLECLRRGRRRKPAGGLACTRTEDDTLSRCRRRSLMPMIEAAAVGSVA